MRKTLQDQYRLADLDSALAQIIARRPALTDIATAFALVQKGRLAARQALPDAPLSPFDTALASEGRPQLDPLLFALAKPATPLIERFLTAAGHVLPALAQAFPKLAEPLARIAVTLASPDGPELAASLLAALAPEAKEDALSTLAQAHALDPDALQVAAREILLAVVSHEALLLESAIDQGAWMRGWCPICGGGPDAGFLKEAPEDSEFLIAKAGQLWLHCSQCAALWRHPRMRCASCGCEDHKSLDLLLAEEDARAEHERAQLCSECGTYTLSINLVDRSDQINLELLPMLLLHLDVLAQQRGFKPAAPSPWNDLS